MPSLNIEVEEAVLQPGLHPGPVHQPVDTAYGPGRGTGFLLRLRPAGLLLLLSLLAIAITGYHPYGEDAGIYVAGIKQAAHRNLYGTSSAFITPFFRLSLFTNWNAWVVRSLHLPLEDVLFSMQILTTWLLLYACWRLARQCLRPEESPWGSVFLLSLCLSLPVAGSSLFLMDPYLTGRSFSTPLTLLAVCGCLEGKILRTAVPLILVGLFHPLMSIYATGFVLLLWAVKRESWIGVAGLVTAALGTGAVLQYSQRAVVESPAYRAAVASRYYFFLSRWQWYELVGIAAPLLLLGAYCYWKRSRPDRPAVVLARTCVILGITSIAASLLFSRPSSPSHLIAALQTIRAFLFVYFCMFLLLGGLIGQYFLKRVVWRWAFLLICVGSGLAIVQHQAYPASAQIEFPWLISSNGWTRAFLWVRSFTPADAVVALDADYIHAPGEDSQGFRAIAERNSLADRSKDGGAAAVFPILAERWMIEQTATTGLNTMSDAERLRRLTPFHVGWIILERSAATSLLCPFEDDLVKVCRMR